MIPFAMDALSAGLILGGVYFLLAGTVGILRFPDIYTRLHAVTKADSLGLGLVVLGLCFRPVGWAARIHLLVIWLLVLAATATTAHLLARTSLARGTEPAGAPGREAAAGPASGGEGLP